MVDVGCVVQAGVDSGRVDDSVVDKKCAVRAVDDIGSVAIAVDVDEMVWTGCREETKAVDTARSVTGR